MDFSKAVYHCFWDRFITVPLPQLTKLCTKFACSMFDKHWPFFNQQICQSKCLNQITFWQGECLIIKYIVLRSSCLSNGSWWNLYSPELYQYLSEWFTMTSQYNSWIIIMYLVKYYNCSSSKTCLIVINRRCPEDNLMPYQWQYQGGGGRSEG